MITIIKYTPRYKKVLMNLFGQFQKYLVSIDTFNRLCCSKDYGEKYVNNLLKLLGKSGIILLAEVDGVVVGFIIGIIEKLPYGERIGHNKKYKIARVFDLFVEEKYRGRKIGALLMNTIEKYFKMKKCDHIRVEIYAPNTNTHQFYLKQGYTDESIDLVKKI